MIFAARTGAKTPDGQGLWAAVPSRGGAQQAPGKAGCPSPWPPELQRGPEMRPKNKKK